MKILCLCSYGNVRSSCLARQLKDYYYQEALVAGLVANTPSTLQMLVEWADLILIVCELDPANYIENFPSQKRPLQWDFNPGPDKWQTPSHPELVAIMTEKIEQSGLFPMRRIV